MAEKSKRIKEIKEILEKEPKELTRTVSIIFDGRQYSIRIPRDFAEKANIDPKKDKFEFTLKIPKEKEYLPELSGELIEEE